MSSSSDILPLKQAFAHFPNIGPVRLGLMRQAGIRQWDDIEPNPPPLLNNWSYFWEDIYNAAVDAREAFANGNLQFFTQNLKPSDRWRLLHLKLNQTTFIDIETSGLESLDNYITTIVAFDGQKLHTFVKNENLEDFPDFLLTLKLIVTYNGSTFDLPKIMREFNLPNIPVPHVDLRWLCHNCFLDGGLKNIEKTLNIKRPEDIRGTDGNDAVILWNQWANSNDHNARRKLVKYCAADTISLLLVARKLLEIHHCDNVPDDDGDPWRALDQIPQSKTNQTTPVQNETCNTQHSINDRLKAFLNKKRRH